MPGTIQGPGDMMVWYWPLPGGAQGLMGATKINDHGAVGEML